VPMPSAQYFLADLFNIALAIAFPRFFFVAEARLSRKKRIVGIANRHAPPSRPLLRESI
jgi:hypothetical protein